MTYPALEVARATRLAREREELVLEAYRIVEACPMGTPSRLICEALVDQMIIPWRDMLKDEADQALAATIEQCEQAMHERESNLD